MCDDISDLPSYIIYETPCIYISNILSIYLSFYLSFNLSIYLSTYLGCKAEAWPEEDEGFAAGRTDPRGEAAERRYQQGHTQAAQEPGIPA